MESFRTFSSLELVRANACNRYVNILHSIGMRQHQLHFDGEIASRWDAYLLCDICRHFASVMLRLASLISHNLRCIPAYTHQIPMGFFWPIIVISYWISIIWSGREISRPYHAKPFWEVWYILPFLFWGGGFAPILAKFIVFLHLKILMRLDNELLMNLLAVAFGKSW